MCWKGFWNFYKFKLAATRWKRKRHLSSNLLLAQLCEICLSGQDTEPLAAAAGRITLSSLPLSLRQKEAVQEALIKTLPVWLARRIKELGAVSGIILPLPLRVEVASLTPPPPPVKFTAEIREAAAAEHRGTEWRAVWVVSVCSEQMRNICHLWFL